MPTRKFIILPLALLLVGYGYLSINVPLPIFPKLEGILHVDTQDMQFLMSLFLGCYAISELVWGSLADSLGCRRILLTSLLISLVGTTLTIMTLHYNLFLCGRVIEAFGVGSSSVLMRTVLADWLDGKTLAIGLMYAISLVSLMPGLSPLIGSVIFFLTGSWRAVFGIILVVGLLTSAVVYWGYWDNPNRGLQPLTWKLVVKRYANLLCDLNFTRYFIIYGLKIGLLINFYTIAPGIFIKHLHLKHHIYVVLVLLVSCSYFMGAVCTRILLRKQSVKRILYIGMIFVSMASLCYLLEWNFSVFSAWTITVPMIIFAFGCGFISPACNTLAMENAQEKGSAGALMAFVAMATASLFSYIMMKLPLNHLSSYVLTFVSSSLLSWILLIYMRTKHLLSK